MQSSLAFRSGASDGGYPISGYGLSAVLLALGAVQKNTDAFPFIIIQVLVGLAVTAIMMKRQLRNNTMRAALAGYGMILIGVGLASRAFLDSNLGYVIAVMSLAAFAEPQAAARPAAPSA